MFLFCFFNVEKGAGRATRRDRGKRSASLSAAPLNALFGTRVDLVTTHTHTHTHNDTDDHFHSCLLLVVLRPDSTVEETPDRTLAANARRLWLCLWRVGRPTCNACVCYMNRDGVAQLDQGRLRAGQGRGWKDLLCACPPPTKTFVFVFALCAHVNGGVVVIVGLLWDMHNPDDIRRINKSKKAGPPGYYRILSLDGGGTHGTHITTAHTAHTARASNSSLQQGCVRFSSASFWSGFSRSTPT